MEMSRLTRDGTAEPVSRDQILRHVRGQGDIHFPCSADHEQDWQPYPVDPYSAICDDHTYTHTYIHITGRKFHRALNPRDHAEVEYPELRTVPWLHPRYLVHFFFNTFKAIKSYFTNLLLLRYVCFVLSLSSLSLALYIYIIITLLYYTVLYCIVYYTGR